MFGRVLMRVVNNIDTHAAELLSGQRFEFGANWSAFLRTLNPQRVALAERSLQSYLGVRELRGKSFLDVGSGSGLFSLAARRLGASVRSFDYDPLSVQCTRELKSRYCRDDADWTIEEGSILDSDYLSTLGKYDVVYSWGVLHHTGEMWTALANTAALVAHDGMLFVALYNDQGPMSSRWRTLKRLYNRLPRWLRAPYLIAVMGTRELRLFVGATLRLRLWSYVDGRLHYAERSLRGMSYWHDLVDWIGGYPFEVATPDEVFEFCRDRGFKLKALKTSGGGIACNQFVFVNEQ